VIAEPGSHVLILQVLPDCDEDAEELDDLTVMRRVVAVEPILPDRPPEDTKGFVTPLGAGWRSTSARRRVHPGRADPGCAGRLSAEPGGTRGQRRDQASTSGGLLKILAVDDAVPRESGGCAGAGRPWGLG
jgi:hypothetical protein